MPDYFTRPIQNDRLSQDYGNTKLRFDGQPKRGTIRRFLFGLFVAAIGWGGFTLAVAILSTPRP